MAFIIININYDYILSLLYPKISPKPDLTLNPLMDTKLLLHGYHLKIVCHNLGKLIFSHTFLNLNVINEELS